MRANLPQGLAGRSRRHRLGLRCRLQRHAQGDRRAEPSDPGIRAVGQPVVVAQVGKPLIPPRLAPGILNPETVLVIGDDREGMAAENVRRGLDMAIPTDRMPALVHAGAGVQYTDFGNRRVHGDDVGMVDPEVRPQRTQRRLLGQHLGQGRGLVIGLPPRCRAHPVLVPALHRPATTGTFVHLAGPFVITTGQVVQHVRADERGVGLIATGAQQVMRHRRQAITGAGVFLALVEYRHPGLAVVAEFAAYRDFHQGRDIHGVTKIQAVRSHVQDPHRGRGGLAAGDLLASPGGRCGSFFRGFFLGFFGCSRSLALFDRGPVGCRCHAHALPMS